jgi:hypothetical protein
MPALNDLSLNIMSPTSFQTIIPPMKKTETVVVLGYKVKWSLKADMSVILGSSKLIPIDNKPFKVENLGFGNTLALTQATASTLLLASLVERRKDWNAVLYSSPWHLRYLCQNHQ